MVRIFLLQCPSCKNQMKYGENLNTAHNRSDISSKSKRCVYCGRNFKVLPSILKEL